MTHHLSFRLLKMIHFPNWTRIKSDLKYANFFTLFNVFSDNLNVFIDFLLQHNLFFLIFSTWAGKQPTHVHFSWFVCGGRGTWTYWHDHTMFRVYSKHVSYFKNVLFLHLLFTTSCSSSHSMFWFYFRFMPSFLLSSTEVNSWGSDIHIEFDFWG